MTLIRVVTVSIPFKRESIYAQADGWKNCNSRVQFQFPSNGKAYMHSIEQETQAAREAAFQFPSNGKAYMHRKNAKVVSGRAGFVSIPFKREGIYARIILLVAAAAPAGFNSLQTGKHICTILFKTNLYGFHVSIPFKRESIYAQN